MNKVKQYLSMEIEVIVFPEEDVITFSAGTNNGADGHQPDGDWWVE